MFHQQFSKLAVVRSFGVYAGGYFTKDCGNLDCNNANTSVNRVAKYAPAISTPTPSKTATKTATMTRTATRTMTPTLTRTATKTKSPTKTATATATATMPNNGCAQKPAAPQLAKPKANAALKSPSRNSIGTTCNARRNIKCW